ncbi:MAG: DUF2071 domain-containing protein [Verrucomicrobiota bacterium]
MPKPESLGPVIMYQRWESLLFLHWEIAAHRIQETLPTGLEVDTYDGKAFLGIVPFKMRQVRPRFLCSMPLMSNFLELNLRTYVRDRSGRPGVWFYSLDANQAIAVWIARKFFSLPYQHASMQLADQDDGWILFRSQRTADAEQFFGYRSCGDFAPAEDGSLDHFLVERYRLYSFRENSGRLYSGMVSHQPYNISPAEVSDYSRHLFELNGFEDPGRSPDHVVLADAVDVNIHPLGSVDSKGKR